MKQILINLLVDLLVDLLSDALKFLASLLLAWLLAVATPDQGAPVQIPEPRLIQVQAKTEIGSTYDSLTIYNHL